MTDRPVTADRLAGIGPTIFAEMTKLAVATDSINLGQGFPDTDGPSEVLNAATAAIAEHHNQYSPGVGVAELRTAVADHQRRFRSIDVDADTGVLVTSGATEAIAAAMLSLVNPGDEVVMFEPFYDSYVAAVAMAGGIARFVPLNAPDDDHDEWWFDPDDLHAAVSPSTRLILLNTPHNPTGKVFTSEELRLVAAVAIEHDLIVVTDEVYEHLVYDGAHIALASLPAMSERTLTISSGGKTFSLTGWKVGWISGPEHLVSAVRLCKQFLTYCTPAPLQLGIAAGLRMGDGYFAGLAADMVAKRDRLAAGLAAVGLEPYRAAGGYFLTTDVSALGDHTALDFCLTLPGRVGVVAIPSSAFYAHPDRGRTLVRWAFCKRHEVLDEAVDRLSGIR